MFAHAGAVGCFRNGQAVRVICATDFAPQCAAQILVEWFSDQPCGIGVLHETSPRGNSSGNAHAHGGASPKFFLDSFHGVGHGAHGCLVGEARRRGAVTVQFRAVTFERHEFDLRAAKIHTDAKVLLLFLSGRHG